MLNLIIRWSDKKPSLETLQFTISCNILAVDNVISITCYLTQVTNVGSDPRFTISRLELAIYSNRAAPLYNSYQYCPTQHDVSQPITPGMSFSSEYRTSISSSSPGGGVSESYGRYTDQHITLHSLSHRICFIRTAT
jgi:hypothetical protein